MLLGLMLLAPSAGAAASPPRLALVIGNSGYAVGPLENPIKDARAMAAALETAGFEVMLRTDATRTELIGALRQFGDALRSAGPGAAGAFYFAGHGVQIKGRNFLIPVDADIAHEDEVAYQSLDAQAVIDKMESAGNGSNLLILDACRNNPFARGSRDTRNGLAQMDAPVGMLVAFATAPGATASDGLRGGHGLYTSHLLDEVRKPGLKVEEVFKRVRAAVVRDSRGRQVPWESTALVGDFYFVPPSARVPPEAPNADEALDHALWALVRESRSRTEVQAYLRRFPNGRHADEAQRRLQALQAGDARDARVAAPDTPPQAPATSPVEAPSSPERLVGSAPSADPKVIWDLARVDDDNSAVIAESKRRIDEILRWGDEGTDRRPAQSRRNANGLAMGDRWRYRVLNLMRDEFIADYLYRIDGINDDGSLRVNDGATRLDPWGQPIEGRDPDGNEVVWDPPPPVASIAGEPAGHERRVSLRVRSRSASGVPFSAELSGEARVVGVESISTEAGRFDATRVDLHVSGTGRLADGRLPYVRWRHSYWLVPRLGLPLAMQFEEWVGSEMQRRERHALTAADVQAIGRVLALER